MSYKELDLSRVPKRIGQLQIRTFITKMKNKDISFTKKVYQILDNLDWELSPLKIQWHLENGIDFPKCLECAKPARWKSPEYTPYCSMRCANSSTAKFAKTESTNKERYGSINYFSTDRFQQERREQNLAQYGVDHYSKTKEYKDKVRKTSQERYGVDNYASTIECREKMRETSLVRYGVGSYFQTQEFQEQVRETSFERYGVEHHAQSPLIKAKRIKTNLELYGVHHSVQRHLTPDVVEKLSSKKWMKAQVKANRCVEEVADELGVTYSAILHRARQYNLHFSKPTTSRQEREISQFLDELGIRYQMNTRKIIAPLELDFYIRSIDGVQRKIGIECDGWYWHSDLHYEKDRHANKLEACREKGITLIAISEVEWTQRQDQVKHRLRHILGRFNHREYARNLVVEPVSKKDCKAFLDKWHLQGACGSSVQLGLYKVKADGSKKLGAVMTFGKPRFNKDHDWELLRFASIPAVVGGASKLFNAFLRREAPSSIVSYSNNAYGIGGLYNALGFQFVSNKVGYFYTDGYEILSRIQCQKHRLVEMGYDDKLSERQIMDERGFVRVYDYGQTTWSWRAT